MQNLLKRLEKIRGLALGLVLGLGVARANTLPAISSIPDQGIQEDASALLPFSIGDAETPLASLSLVATTDNPILFSASSFVFDGGGSSRTLKIAPIANRSGSARVRVRVIDAEGASASTLFTITVNPVNDAPTISAIPDQILNEDASLTLPFAIGDAEASPSVLSLVATTDNPVLFSGSSFTLGGSGSSRTLKIAPIANRSGSARVRVRVTDAEGASASTLFTVTVNPVNDAPTITAIPDQVLNEDASVTLPFTLGDAETPPANLSLLATTDNPTLFAVSDFVFGGGGTRRTVRIQPIANRSGSGHVRIRVTDADGATSSTLFKITVNPVNDPPTISAIPDQSLPIGGSSASIPFTIGDAETPASQLSLVATTSNPALVPVSGITLGGSGTTRSLRITPSRNQKGIARVRIRVNNPDGGTGSALFTVYVGEIRVLAGIPSGVGNVDGLGEAARFDRPDGACLDGAGNLYVSDFANHTIRKITPAGEVSTLAGTPGISGSADGQGATASFNNPFGMAMAPSGNMYVADAGNGTIRKITPAGEVVTVAGKVGYWGNEDGPALAATFSLPTGLAVDAAENVYVSCSVSRTIRKLTPAGQVSTLAGSPVESGYVDGPGAEARFAYPAGLAITPTGTLLVTDAPNESIRSISPDGWVTTHTPGIRVDHLAVDASGGVYASQFGQIIKLGAPAPLAGAYGEIGSNDGPGDQARFYAPAGLVVSPTGTLFVVDSGNNNLRKITAGGLVSTLAGKASQPGSTDGTANARFRTPQGLAVVGGNLFLADLGNYTIRKVTPAGEVSTLAGFPGAYGYADGVGSEVRFSSLQGLAADASGNLYATDCPNYVIRKITPEGQVSTLAGTPGVSGSADGPGASASFYLPSGVAVDAQGNVFVTEDYSATIRKITPEGVVSTFAGKAGEYGTQDGPGSEARFCGLKAIAVDASGNLFVSDRSNTIRKITPDGMVSTLAGSPGCAGSNDGQGPLASFRDPRGLTVDASGRLLVADAGNHTIRRIDPDGWVSTILGVAGEAMNLPGPLPGVLSNPEGLAIAPTTGALYISLPDAVLEVAF